MIRDKSAKNDNGQKPLLPLTLNSIKIHHAVTHNNFFCVVNSLIINLLSVIIPSLITNLLLGKINNFFCALCAKSLPLKRLLATKITEQPK